MTLDDSRETGEAHTYVVTGRYGLLGIFGVRHYFLLCSELRDGTFSEPVSIEVPYETFRSPQCATGNSLEVQDFDSEHFFSISPHDFSGEFGRAN